MRRHISESSKPRQNAVPTMEQLRAPFQKKNSTTMYYTISIILGTVAFSYGSVPMYKMARHYPPHHEHKLTAPDLPNHRFWRTTYKSTRARWS
jgi:hypothetical protein